MHRDSVFVEHNACVTKNPIAEAAKHRTLLVQLLLTVRICSRLWAKTFSAAKERILITSSGQMSLENLLTVGVDWDVHPNINSNMSRLEGMDAD
jgi:hypothetical protein